MIELISPYRRCLVLARLSRSADRIRAESVPRSAGSRPLAKVGLLCRKIFSRLPSSADFGLTDGEARAAHSRLRKSKLPAAGSAELRFRLCMAERRDSSPRALLSAV